MGITRHFLPVVTLTLLLAGCGGGDPLDVFEGDPGAAGADGKSILLAVSTEAPGGHCATGGSKIDAGQDANANGLLDANEVSSTQYICGGASAGAAASTLVQTADEPSGVNCAAGGKTINVGIDSNANGVLEAGEVTSIGYVCNGSNGANGTSGANGSNGLNMLMSIVVEAAGANCAYGGQKTSSGLDANADNLLDGAEVSATSYICNGMPGATLSWEIVTDAAMPTQATANTGYVANNATAQVVVTLPASSNMAIGDVVRVSGAGLGGWKIAQNDRQAVSTKNIGGIGVLWETHGPVAKWQSVASSADGRKLVAVAYGGQIYTSTDSGVSWTPQTDNQYWQSVASSADGSKLVAVVDGGRIWTSDKGGEGWIEHPELPPLSWTSVASSADGSKLVALAWEGQIYTSDNGGADWAAQLAPTSPAPSWTSVASSADGSKLVAVARQGQIYTSDNAGAAWVARGTKRSWKSVASSADGIKLVAVADGSQIYTSINSGASWAAQGSAANWRSVASSGDGSMLVAVADFGQIYTSSDSGANWTAHEANRRWISAACSADGSMLVAAVLGSNGSIHTSMPTTTLGTGGSISGGASDAIELRYVGNGIFTVLSHEGTLSFQ